MEELKTFAIHSLWKIIQSNHIEYVTFGKKENLSESWIYHI